MIRTTDFDAIAASAPLNREASVVRDGSGDLYDAPVPSFQAHWSEPPLPERDRPHNAPALEGIAFGRMKVIRYHRPHKKHGAQWLCRCACGDYELRQTPAIKRMATGCVPEHSCEKCRWLRVINHRLKTSTTESRAAEQASLDRLADRSGCCADCKSPATCRWQAKCALYHTEAA